MKMQFQAGRLSKGVGMLKYCKRSLVLLLVPLLIASPALSQVPNIVLIYVDDLGYGDLGSYGHPIVKTPHLDQLARGGMRLTNYYAPSALCSPSRAALLTGRTPYRTGIKSWIPHDTGIYLRSDEITLAEVLRAEGYATALVGKWHLNSDLASENEPQPTDQGFDYFYGHNAFQIPTNRNPTNVFRGRTKLPVQEGYTAQLYADEAIGWLERRKPDRPFFLYLSMAEPHTTIANPPEYDRLYSKFTNGPVVPIPSGLSEVPKEKLVPRGPGENYANITYMDAQIGRVLDRLRQKNLTEETIVVFASDNGPVTEHWINWYEVNAYGSTGGLRGRKHYLYEGGIKVPAIISYPGKIQEGSESQELIIGMDLFVTLARLAGGTVPTDREIDGIDVSSVFDGATLPERTILCSLDSRSDLEYVVRRGAWKLFLDRSESPVELYNLENDPLEFFNLRSESRAKVEELTKWFDEIRSTLQAKNFEDSH